MISDPIAAQRALLAMYAEDMYDDKKPVLAPSLDSRCVGQWKLLGHLVAKNALLGAQYLTLGESSYFGFFAQSISTPTQFIAVVRGTEAPIEWLENFEGLLVDRPGIGWVEQGFDSIYRSMRYVAVSGAAAATTSAAAAIGAQLPAGSTVTVIGHSLGAALGSYLMLDLGLTPSRKFRVEGTLFASPRAGGRDFVQRVDHAVDAYRVYNYMRDIVPHVPPSLPLPINFESLPQTVWIKPADAQAVINNNPMCNHHAYCYAAMLDFDAVTAATAGNTPCVARRA